MISRSKPLDLALATGLSLIASGIAWWLQPADFPTLEPASPSRLMALFFPEDFVSQGEFLLVASGLIWFVHLLLYCFLAFENPWLKLFFSLLMLNPEVIGFFFSNLDLSLGSLGLSAVFFGYRRRLDWVGGPGGALAASALPGGFLAPLWLMAVSENRRSLFPMTLAALLIGGICAYSDLLPFPWLEGRTGFRLNLWLEFGRVYLLGGFLFLAVIVFAGLRKRLDLMGLLILSFLIPVQFPGFGVAEILPFVPLFFYGLVLMFWSLSVRFKDFSVLSILLFLHLFGYAGFVWQREARALWFGWEGVKARRMKEMKLPKLDAEVSSMRKSYKSESK